MNGFELATVVTIGSVCFSLIHWGVTKMLDELYWNLYKKHVDKKNEDAFNADLFGGDVAEREGVGE